MIRKLTATAAIVFLSACGNNAPTCTPMVAPDVPSPQLRYPKPNATNVPTDIGVVIYDAPAQYGLLLQAGSTTINGSARTVPSPLPTPIAPAIGPSFAASIPALQAHTNYDVSILIPDNARCGSEVLPLTPMQIGSFTTQ